MIKVYHFWKLALSVSKEVVVLVWKPRGLSIGIMLYKWCAVIPICVQWNPAFALLVGLPFTPRLRDCPLGRHLDFGLFAVEWRKSNPPAPPQ